MCMALPQPGSMLMCMASVTTEGGWMTGSGQTPESLFMSEAYISIWAVIIWMAYTITRCYAHVWAQAAAMGHIWICDPAAARIWIDVHVSYCPWRLITCPGSGEPPKTILVSKSLAATRAILIWVFCAAIRGHSVIWVKLLTRACLGLCSCCNWGPW